MYLNNFFLDTHSKQNKLFPSSIDILGPIYVENICHPPSRANFIFVSHLNGSPHFVGNVPPHWVARVGG